MADADAEKEFLELSSKARGDTDWIVPALKLINVNNVLAFVDDTSTGRLIDPPSGTSREDAAKAVLAKNDQRIQPCDLRASYGIQLCVTYMPM